MADLLNIRYASTEILTADNFIDILRRSTLAERRPVDDRPTIEMMLSKADILITAWDEERLVGVSRAISDFAYCTYLSDLAVDVDYQRRGIGKELIERTHVAAGLSGRLVLLAAPAAEEYYRRIGMTQHSSCWTIPKKT